MRSHTTSSSPGRRTGRHNPIPVRYVFAGVVVVALFIMFPLLTVWKQAYITGASVIQKDLADSLDVLTQRAARLRMTVEELSSNERIERLAHDWLDLGHPSADRIVIVHMSPEHSSTTIAGMMLSWKFLSIIRRSLEQERG